MPAMLVNLVSELAIFGQLSSLFWINADTVTARSFRRNSIALSGLTHTLYLPLLASCRIIALMLACFLFQLHKLLDLCHWAQWRSLHLSAIRILHARNLVKTPPGRSKSNTGDQIDAQIPTATVKVRRQLTRPPLTASCRWNSKRVYKQYRAKQLLRTPFFVISSHGGPPLARRGVLLFALVVLHTKIAGLIVKLFQANAGRKQK
ncbi:hypothetical protein HD554DRAFT_597868 [Boletus coccyginus]|nr:hypothetical protein HD554DRAFT_597868 [Boletus coccyginus]